MSLHPDPARCHATLLAAAAMAAALGVTASAAHAQTIADYGRAQRALLEATMAQTAARAAALSASSPTAAGASLPGAGVPTGGAPAATAAPAGGARMASWRSEPTLAVSGVFASSRVAWAEIVVDGRAWRLTRGEDVPGTAWRVAAVSPDEVRLDRVAGGSPRNATRQRRFVLGGGR